MELHKICGVCGDKALGYNFNALTCESCKAFFRRNALRNKNFRCITAGNCVLNPKTRKYCRKCRLDKCFQIGMKKDWILTEEEKVLKRRKHRNRDTEKKDADSSSMNLMSPDSKSSPKLGDNKKNNIIILPILPLSVNGEDSSEVFQSLNKNELISYINNRLNLSLDTESSNISFNHKNGSLGASSDEASVDNNNNNSFGNNNIIVLADGSSFGKDTRNAMDLGDFGNGSENSSSSFSSLFSGNHNGGSTSWVKPDNQVTVGNDPHNDSMMSENASAVAGFGTESNLTGGNCHGSSSCCNRRNDSNEYVLRISDDVYKHAIQLEYTTNPLKNNEPDSIKKLNQLEETRLSEVNQHFKPISTINNAENHKTITELHEEFSYFELAIKQLIIAVKNIQAFKNMCQEDQIALLKGSASEIKGLLNMRYFDPALKMCIVPDPQDKDSAIAFDHEYVVRTYGENLYERCKSFLLSFQPEWRQDDSIINLLSMILLFYPNRPNLLHREYIMLEYLTYCHLLQRYLEVKYGSICEAKSAYLILMSRLEEMHDLNEHCMELMLKMDLNWAKYVGPITSELYDLNLKLQQQKMQQQQQQMQQQTIT